MSGATPRRTAPNPEARRRAAAVFQALAKRYPEAHCELNWKRPHELLIATILSAQATDVAVNKATPGLFAAFPTPADFSRATADQIAVHLQTLNFWRMKARAVQESMAVICTRHSGQVPRTLAELVQLRGVARKTANVVLGNAFEMSEGVVVDTHVLRLARRFGLTRATTPEAVERDLMRLFPRERWCLLSHLLIFHGRRVCKARGATCDSDAICHKYCSNCSTNTPARCAASATRAAASRRRPSTRPRLGRPAR